MQTQGRFAVEVSRWLRVAAAGLILLPAAAARAQVVISTLGLRNNSASPWGTPDSGATPTYGQTFVDPVGNPFLQSVTFTINTPSPSPIPFKAYVYSWTGSAIAGPTLFQSGPLSVPPSGAAFAPVTVAGMNTQLVPGKTYAVFFSTIGFTGQVDNASWGLTPSAAYPPGKFVYNNSLTFAGLFAPANPPWNEFGDLGNSEFALSFTPTGSAVPEPSSFALLGLGLASIALAGWRGRRRTYRR